MEPKSSLRCNLLLLLCIVLFGLFGCKASSKDSGQEAEIVEEQTGATKEIEGNWLTVWGKYNGKVKDIGKPFMFKTFHDGHFSMMSWDSAGKLSFAGYGKYELDSNRYKETMLYHTTPDYIGGSDWQRYELKGDTLYFYGFDKVVIGGKEVTKDFGTLEEKRVRMK